MVRLTYPGTRRHRMLRLTTRSSAGGVARYRFDMAASIDFTISFDPPDEQGWIVARVLEVPGAMSQGRTREEARENALDALRTVLTPDEELEGQTPDADREHLRFTAAA
jgi:predicted RNase H-like HicB family nuclease